MYDVVHVSREFKEDIDATKAANIAPKKFAFKEIAPPTVAAILARVDKATLEAAWEQQLRHQLPHLPPVESFLADLPGALSWWLEPERAPAELPAIAASPGQLPVRAQRFPAVAASNAPARFRSSTPRLLGGPLERIRYAARNRLCARVTYHGVSRLVEPYSLRRPTTGNLLLYVYELDRAGRPSNSIKAFKIGEIRGAEITDRPFTPQFRVEL